MKEKIWENIYDMELGDILQSERHGALVRVPGGWVYENSKYSCCFIPFDNEFQSTQRESKRSFTEKDLTGLQSRIHKITGDGEVMQEFNKLLGNDAI